MSQIANRPVPARAPGSVVTPGSAGQRLLLSCGVVGPLLFNGVYLIEGIARPGYDPWRQAVSALSLGAGGWVQSANFIIFGLFSAGFALGFRAALTPGLGATAAPLLQGLVVLSLIIVGIFAQDPTSGYPPGVPAPATPTLHAMLHLAGTVVSLTARAVWALVVAVRFAREPGWRGWAVYAVVTAMLTIGFMAAFGAALAQHGPAGLFERLALISTSLLSMLVAARLLAGTGRVDPLRRQEGREI